MNVGNKVKDWYVLYALFIRQWRFETSMSGPRYQFASLMWFLAIIVIGYVLGNLIATWIGLFLIPLYQSFALPTVAGWGLSLLMSLGVYALGFVAASLIWGAPTFGIERLNCDKEEDI